MKRLNIFRSASIIHKWLGLVLAIQVFLWIGGGVIMSAIPLDKVHGKHLAQKHLDKTLNTYDYTYSLDKIVSRIPTEVHSIMFVERLKQPVYKVVLQNNTMMFDAKSGYKLGDITADQVAQLAQLHYVSDGQLINTVLLDNIPMEASRAKNTVWQANFDDTWSTSLYFDPVTAELLAIRSDIWRLFDFVWMLHIMDYDEREDFNNPLLITFSVSALLFTISGIIMLFRSFRVKRWLKKRA